MSTPLTTVAWLTWRQLFARRRGWLAAAIVVLPFILTFFYRLGSEDREGDRLIFMLNMNREVVLGVLLPLTAVIFGATAFGGEVEDGTLIYLLVRPVDRWKAAISKYLVSVAVTIAVMIGAVLVAWFALRTEELPFAVPRAFIVASALGSLAYCALFGYIGLVTRKGLVIGLLYVILFENIAARGFEGAKSLSVREFAVSLAQWAGDGVVKWQQPGVSMTTVWVVGSIILGGALALTLRKLARYEMAERL